MKTIFLYLLLTCCTYVYSQQTSNTLVLKFDKEKKTIEVPKKTIAQGELYTLKLEGINTSFMKVDISAIEKELVTPIPEVLKPILPGITTSLTFNKSINSISSAKGLMDNDYSKIYSIVRASLKPLENLKFHSSEIYKRLNDKEISNENIQKYAFDIATKLIKEFVIDTLINEIRYKDSINEYNGKLREAISQGILQFGSARKFLEGKLTTGFETAESTRENQLVELHASLSQLESRLKLDEYLKYYTLLINAQKIETFKIWPSKFSSSKDVLETSVSIINTFTNDTIYNNKLDFYTRGGGGLRLNFSTGFFYSNLIEKSYYLKERNSSTKSVLEEKSNNFDVSIGGLAHLTYKFSSYTDIGLNLGISVSPLDGKTRYLLGGGFLVGKKDKIGLTAGATVAKLNKLSGTVQTDAQGNFVPLAITGVPLTQQNKWGFYFGISYNVLRSKK